MSVSSSPSAFSPSDLHFDSLPFASKRNSPVESARLAVKSEPLAVVSAVSWAQDFHRKPDELSALRFAQCCQQEKFLKSKY